MVRLRSFSVVTACTLDRLVTNDRGLVRMVALCIRFVMVRMVAVVVIVVLRVHRGCMVTVRALGRRVTGNRRLVVRVVALFILLVVMLRLVAVIVIVVFRVNRWRMVTVRALG
jgi:hypothetical protein